MPDDEDEFVEIDLDELEDVSTKGADPDVDAMLENAFANAFQASVLAPATIPTPANESPDSDLDDRPTDRPPPIADPDEVEFNNFMNKFAQWKPPNS